MSGGRSPSQLHLQMGQETIYLLLTIAIFAAVLLAAYSLKEAQEVEEPPIITLTEAAGFSFPSGSAEVSPEFYAKLDQNIARQVRAAVAANDARVVEVIGHTDATPLGGGRGSQLDDGLARWYLEPEATAPQAADNVGLGMLRAVAVARALREIGLGDGVAVAPMSAGAFLLADDSVATGAGDAPDASRRRIEIRVRRQAGSAASSSSAR